MSPDKKKVQTIFNRIDKLAAKGKDNIYEYHKLIDELVEKGWVTRKTPRHLSPDSEKPNLLEIEWMDMVGKLSDLRQRVTLEEEQAIKELVSKYL